MAEDDIKKRVREISLTELAGSLGRSKIEKKPHERRSIEADDPYFSVLDSGRDILVWFRRHKDIKKELSEDMGQLIIELEKMLHKIQQDAINDEFDYNAKHNEYYFDMGHINNLLANVKTKLKVFMKNGKFLMSTDDMSQKGFETYKSQIRKLADTCEKMEKDIRIFMGEMEKQYGIEPMFPGERTLTPNPYDEDY